MQRSALDSKRTGFIAGMVIPLVSFILFYLFRYRAISLHEFLNYIYFRDILSPLLSLNILPNLLVFYLFIRREYYSSARGLLLATFVYAGIVLFLKVFS